VNLRVYIRTVCNRLCKHFKNFIDKMGEGSQNDVVSNALSLFEIRQRNNEREVPTVFAFLKDIDTLVANVKESAQTDSLKARQFINEACHLQDQCLSMMSQVNRDLVKHCDRMAAERGDVDGAVSNRRKVSFGPEQGQNNNGSDAAKDGARKSSLRNGHRSDKAERDEEEEAREMEDDAEEDEQEKVDEAEDVDMRSLSVAVVDVEQDDGEEVQLNKRRMTALTNKLVKLSKGYTVQEMEDKMYGVLRIIYAYSNQLPRDAMLDELEQHIETYFQAKSDWS